MKKIAKNERSILLGQLREKGFSPPDQPLDKAEYKEVVKNVLEHMNNVGGYSSDQVREDIEAIIDLKSANDKFYEINLDENIIDEIIFKTQGKNSVKKNISDSALLPWALSSNFRKGKIGEWKKEFTSNNIFEFKSKSNSILVKLGYETNDNW